MIRFLFRTLFLLIVLVVAAAGVTYLYVQRGNPFSARAVPSRLEATMARQLRHLSMPADQRDKRNPLPGSADDLHEGLEHFADHCAMCHANNGSGDTPIGRGLYPKPPMLRQGATQSLSDGELFSIIQNGIRFTGMPAFAVDHDDDDTWRLVLFIRHLPKVTDRELAEMEKLNPHGPVEAPAPAHAGSTPAAPHTHTHPHKAAKD